MSDQSTSYSEPAVAESASPEVISGDLVKQEQARRRTVGRRVVRKRPLSAQPEAMADVVRTPKAVRKPKDSEAIPAVVAQASESAQEVALESITELAESVAHRPVLVEMKDVVKRYSKTHLALDHVNLKLYKGEFLSLVGPSGAGKSTLIKCITLQERPEAGRIVVAGRDITLLRSWELPYYRRKVGVVFQDFKLLPNKTVGENVAFALEVSGFSNREIRSRVPQILETVGMLHKDRSFPHELSGGEQQRVAIARALVHDPKILIADEPTGNLDPVNTWEIIDLLFKINKSGTMVILATHNREIVDALKKRVITMRAGQVVSDQEKGMYLV
jgi:cell division transport system ATP-binding protein